MFLYLAFGFCILSILSTSLNAQQRLTLKGAREMPDLTGLWVENKTNDSTFFVNQRNTKLWNEYFKDRLRGGYRLFMYNGTNPILQNQNPKNVSYLILNDTSYSKGKTLAKPEISNSGFWLKKPKFPDYQKMAKYIKWAANKTYYFKRINNSEIWEEFENNKKTSTLEFRTFTADSVILYSDKAEYVELMENIAKKMFGEIESLDGPSAEKINGEWDISDTYLCGTPVFTPTPWRVHGGSAADPHSYPWLAHIDIYFKGKVNPSSCAGSLISSSWILTAAHCILNQNEVYLGIYLGIHRRTDRTREKIIQVENSSSIFVHPRFNVDPSFEFDRSFDIALIKMPKPVEFTDKIYPICLPDEDYSKNTEIKTVVAGWGLNENFTLPDVLYQVELSLLERKNCILNKKPLSPNLICAGSKNNEKIRDTCQGDSGSAQIIQHPKYSEKYVGIGIVSRGVSSDCTGLGIYTNVFSFKKWIKETIEKEKNETIYFI